MAIDSKQNLSDKYFRQVSGETLNLSGDTVVSGKIRYADGMTPSGATDFITREFFDANTYTDQQAREAQGGTNGILPIKLNSVGPKVYGETTALSVSELTFDLSDSIIGGAAIVHHNAVAKPTIATDLNVLEHGDYVNSVLNQIFFIKSGSSSLSIAYTQPVFTAGTADNTAPTIESATIENGNANRLVVVYSEPVTQSDTTGFAISGDATISVDSIVSGVGTNTITYAISPNAQGGQSLTLNVSVGNNVTDLSSNANPLAAVNQSITNNIGVAQQLATPTGFEANNLTPTSIRLNWNDVTDADNFVLERGQQPDYSDAVSIYTGALLTFDDTGLTADTTYYYRVKAIDDVDNIFGDSNYNLLSRITISSSAIEAVNIMTNPTLVEQNAIANFVDALVTSGDYQHIDEFQYYRLKSESNSLKGWKGVKNALKIGNTDWSASSGFILNGIDACINSNFIPNGAEASNYTLNSAVNAVGITQSRRVADSAGFIIGGRGSDLISNFLNITSSNQLVTRMHDASSTGITTKTQIEAGVYEIRRSSNNVSVLFNGGSIYSETRTLISLPTAPIYFGALNNNGVAATFLDADIEFGLFASNQLSSVNFNNALMQLRLDLGL